MPPKKLKTKRKLTPLRLFLKQKRRRGGNDTCPICFESYNTSDKRRIIAHKTKQEIGDHIMCLSCLENIIDANERNNETRQRNGYRAQTTSCPLCRAPLLSLYEMEKQTSDADEAARRAAEEAVTYTEPTNETTEEWEARMTAADIIINRLLQPPILGSIEMPGEAESVYAAFSIPEEIDKLLHEDELLHRNVFNQDLDIWYNNELQNRPSFNIDIIKTAKKEKLYRFELDIIRWRAKRRAEIARAYALREIGRHNNDYDSFVPLSTYMRSSHASVY